MVNRMTNKPIVLGTIAALLLSFTACSQLDVVGNDSVRAFDDLLQILPAEDDEYEWSISAPDGGAQFIWNGESAAISVDAQPFIDAGLDISQLSNVGDGEIAYGVDFQSTGREKTTPLDDYKRIKSIGRDSISYHMALDHYGVALGDGNMFEWAKDMSKNDKDTVFVLNPEPLINAGVDPNAVEGWVFAKVEVEMNGKMVEVDKLLKPFDLK